MDLYLSPQGDDIADGRSPETAFRTLEHLSRHVRDFAPGVLSLRLRAGMPHVGTLDLSYPCPVSVLPYDGDTATIQSGAANGFDYSGTGSLTVRGIRCVGSGQPSEGLHTGINVGAAAANLHFEGVEATGYGFAGMLLMGDLRDVTVRKAYLHHNANGFFTSGPTLRRIALLDSEIAHNDLHNPSSSGFGVSANGCEGIEIAGCHIHHNGIRAQGGGGGCMVFLCRHFNIHHNRVEDNTDPNPETGDGWGICADDCRVGFITDNECHRNQNGGIQVHDDSGYTFYPPADITVARNYLTDNVVGLSHQGGAGNILWEGNEVACNSRDGRYRVAVDVYQAGAGTRFRRNILKAEGGALLLMADEGVGGATFAGDDWQSATPAFVSRGRGFTSLVALLAAEPLALSARRRIKPVKLLPGRPERTTGRGERLRAMLANVRKAA